MLLEAQGKYNNLSKEFRAELEAKVRSFGPVVQYKFNISKADPNPEYRGQNKRVWPSRWTLDPVSFSVRDPHENKTSPMKLIALVQEVADEEKKKRGEGDRFQRVRVEAEMGGIVTLHTEESYEDFETAMYLEVHPSHQEGPFSDKTRPQWFQRIDRKKMAQAKIGERSARKKAFETVDAMKPEDMLLFADAMEWPLETDIEILKNKIEEEADTNAEFFNKINEGKTIQLRATVKRAKDKGILSFNPAENTFLWTANGQVAAQLQISEKGDVEALADYLESGGESAKKILDKLKGLLK